MPAGVRRARFAQAFWGAVSRCLWGRSSRDWNKRYHELAPDQRAWRHRSGTLLRGGRALPVARPRGRARARRALARQPRRGCGAPAGRQSSAPRGQDRARLSRLRPAVRRPDRRGQRRAGPGARQVRPRSRLPLRNLRDVVDPRGHTRVRPAQPLAGQDGHHGGAEEALLQPAPHEEPARRAQRGRPAGRRWSAASPRSWASPRTT